VAIALDASVVAMALDVLCSGYGTGCLVVAMALDASVVAMALDVLCSGYSTVCPL
jgi:hypothetical protein